MRKMNNWMTGLLMIVALMLSSCLDDNDWKGNPITFISLTTIQHDDNQITFLTDKGNTLTPLNSVSSERLKDGRRTFVYYYLPEDEVDNEKEFNIYLHGIDTLLTKLPAPYLAEENEETYGDDPVNIEKMFISGGFLNIRFATYWGGKTAHFVNVIQENENDPFTLRFRQNSYDDPKYTWGRAWVSFNLEEILPLMEEKGKETITVEVNIGKEIKSYTVKYEEFTADSSDKEETQSANKLF